MAKKKYKFNPDTLSYESVGLSWKARATKILTYLSSSFALAIIISILFLNFYDTPRSKRLLRENNRLLTQYELLSKDLDKVENVLSELQQRDFAIGRDCQDTDRRSRLLCWLDALTPAGEAGAGRGSQLESALGLLLGLLFLAACLLQRS